MVLLFNVVYPFLTSIFSIYAMAKGKLSRMFDKMGSQQHKTDPSNDETVCVHLFIYKGEALYHIHFTPMYVQLVFRSL